MHHFLQNVSHGAHQKSFPATANKSTTKVKKPDSVEKTRESQNVSGSNSSEHLTENCAHVSKKKRQKKKKQSNSLIHCQGNEELTEGTTGKALHQKKDVSPQKVIDDMVSKENGVTTSQPNYKSLPSSSKSTSSSEATKDEKTNISSTSRDSQNNKTQYPAPHLTVSYSDKVKSSSLNNSNTSKHALGDKSLVKSFTVESSNKIVDAVELGHSSKINVDKNKGTSNLGCKERMALASGLLSNAPTKPPDSTSWGDGEHNQQKYCNSSKSETSNLKQTPRTGKFMGRNNSFKKNACDNDNWRVKKEFLPMADSSTSQKIDSFKKVNTENLNIESRKKITCHQKGEEGVMDSKKYNSVDSGKKSLHVMDKIPKTSSNQQTSSDNNGLSLTELSAKRPVTKLDSAVPIIISSQEPKINQLPAASVNTASSKVGAMKGEFPDLMESTKIKEVPITDGLTVHFMETVTSPKAPPATLSYSAILRSIPKPKVGFRLLVYCFSIPNSQREGHDNVLNNFQLYTL